MPDLNALGQSAMGVAGGPASIDNAVVSESYGASAVWLRPDALLYRGTVDGVAGVVVQMGAARYILAARPSNALAAGGNRWIAHDGAGVFGSFTRAGYSLGLMDSDERGAASADGTLAIVRHGGVGFELHAADGTVVLGPPVLARDLCVIGAGRAIWRDDAGRLGVLGVPAPLQLPAAASQSYVEVPGGPAWLVYFYGGLGLVAHPVTSLTGHLIVAGSAFYPDAELIHGRLVVSYARGPGELPGEAVTVDVWSLPLVDLAPVPDDPIVAINRPCWVGWFEFNAAPSRVPPGNAMIAIRWPLQSETILRMDGSLFARWAAGGSVEEIEQKAAASDVPVLAYWDGRNWPRYPTLRPQDWLGIFGYCYAEETMAVFEANLRHLIAAVPASYPQIAIVCQAFTSNVSLTTNLKGLVPVYARIARDEPRVTFLAPFSDQGRATGLQDHPELVPAWQELFTGVTGTPDTGGGPVPNCGEPGHVPDWDKRMPNRVDVVQRMKDQYPAEWDAMNTAGDTTLIRRIAWALYQEDQRWGLNGKRGGPVLSEDVIAFLNETVANGSRPGMEAADVIISHGAPYAQPGWLDITCSTTQGGSGGLWIKPEAVDPEPPEPTPGAIEVLIHRYDATASRSDPQGWAINYEIASERPVVWIEVGLEGDGEPAIELMFKNEPRIDGRYQRGIFIKPTVEGSWYPRVRAKDDQGHEATADGATPVQVGP